MISSFRNFAKTKFAGLLVFIMIIPFVFWGMGSMFSSGNTNNIAKINNTNISTQDFIDHINRSNIPDETIKANLDKNTLLLCLTDSEEVNLLSSIIARSSFEVGRIVCRLIGSDYQGVAEEIASEDLSQFKPFKEQGDWEVTNIEEYL